MGTEAVWVPYVVAAASAAASYANTTRTAKKQDQALAADIRQSSRRQQDATGEVNRTIDELGTSNPAADKAASLRGYLQQLAAAKPASDQSFGTVTGASDAYAGDAANAALGVDAYGKDLAGTLSRIDAPTQQRLRESNQRDNLEAAIGRISRFASGDHAIANMKLQGIRRNPLLDAFADAAAGYASGKMGQPSTAASGTGWMSADTPALQGLTGADTWLKSILTGVPQSAGPPAMMPNLLQGAKSGLFGTRP